MSSLNIFAEVLQLVWPMIAIFTLIVSLRAKQRHPGQGSTLMVVGSSIALLVSVVNTSMNFAMRFNWLDYDSIGMNYAFTNIISIVAQVLFW
ncbi:hypothetical protein [Neolewinella persica]|uniref:hypothetical protein n=1 Tax=Neolewinella persica TaxID=70998 RepID=UPI00037F1364|nr:hypothetical protein [Neolewinella persica]